MSPELKYERVPNPELHMAFLVSNNHLITYPTIEALNKKRLDAYLEAVIRTDPSYESPAYPGIPIITLRGTSEEKDQKLANTLEDLGANLIISTDSWIPIGPITRDKFRMQILTIEFNPTSARYITKTEFLPKKVRESGIQAENADCYSVYIEIDENRRLPITCGSYAPSYQSIENYAVKRDLEVGIGIEALLEDIKSKKIHLPNSLK